MKANLEKLVDDGGGLFVFHFSCGIFEDSVVGDLTVTTRNRGSALLRKNRQSANKFCGG